MSTRSLVLMVVAAGAVAAGPMVSAQGQAPPVQSGRSSRPIVAVPPPGTRSNAADLEEVTINADAVIGIRLETTIDSERAKLEDPVSARVTRDVSVKGRTAIPAGARLEGYVSSITRGSDRGQTGRLRSTDAGQASASQGVRPGSDRGQTPKSGDPARSDTARIGLRFTTLVLNDGKLRLPIQTETVFRAAEPTAGQTATRVGAGAVVGAILGAAIGGRKGALIGGSAGAAGGAATVAASDRSDVTIAAGTTLTVRLIEPLTLLVERAPTTR